MLKFNLMKFKLSAEGKILWISIRVHSHKHIVYHYHGEGVPGSAVIYKTRNENRDVNPVFCCSRLLVRLSFDSRSSFSVRCLIDSQLCVSLIKLDACSLVHSCHFVPGSWPANITLGQGSGTCGLQRKVPCNTTLRTDFLFLCECTCILYTLPYCMC